MTVISRRRQPGFVAVGTPANVVCKLPFNIAKGIVLRRASSREIERIKKFLRSLGGHMANSEAFENEYVSKRDESSSDTFEIVTHLRKQLPASDWRYLVVALTDCPFDMNDGDISELKSVRLASHLTGKPIYLNPLFTRSMQTSDFTADCEHYPSISIDGGVLHQIDDQFVKDWKICYELIDRTRRYYPAVWHSAKLYQEIPVRHGQHQLTTLGLFAVLESILTHNPRGEEDSISRQIRSKVALLEKRLEIQIDYSAFGEALPETIWKRLYELRSRIAHGTSVTFDKQLQVLDDQETVESFMWKTARSLLRGAMSEPVLYSDLKMV